MSAINIIPVANYIRVRVPVPKEFVTEKHSNSDFGIILKNAPDMTKLESEVITQVNLFYSGFRTMPVSTEQREKRIPPQRINISFCVPKIAEVMSDPSGVYNTGDFVVLAHWNTMSDTTIDKDKEYFYFLLKTDFITGVVKTKEEGEQIFEAYRKGEVEDTAENKAKRIKEEEEILRLAEEDRLAKQELAKKMPKIITDKNG